MDQRVTVASVLETWRAADPDSFAARTGKVLVDHLAAQEDLKRQGVPYDSGLLDRVRGARSRLRKLARDYSRRNGIPGGELVDW